MDALNFLQKVPVFHGLGHEELNQINKLVRERKYRKNMIIFVEGEPGEALYILKNGKVKISKATPDGREQILHILQAGDIFAEVVLFDGGPYPATAEALEESVIGFIKNSDMEELIKTNPDIGIKIMRIMNRRLNSAQRLIRDLALKDTFSRLASTLMVLAKDHGEQTTKGTKITVALSRQELANLVGTSRETVTRALSDLKKQHIIHLEKQYITLLDEEELLSMMGD